MTLLALLIRVTGIFPVQTNAQEIPVEIQHLAFTMDKADCATLTNLSADVQFAFLITSMYLQREGSLSRIVGPDCTFLGEATAIAKISDPLLVMGDTSETLYYLPRADVLLVSHHAENSIAYGMFRKGNVEPLTYFLFHRKDAEQSAVAARAFSETIASLEPPLTGEELTRIKVTPASAARSSASATTMSASSIGTTTETGSTIDDETIPGTGSTVDDLPMIGPEEEPEDFVSPLEVSHMWWIGTIVAVLLALVAVIVLRRKRSNGIT